jgi:Mrp family chromosome partitioning ATPase
LQARLRQIRYRLVVLSGKGGVGKSTVAANLACKLAQAGNTVGLLDVDMHGPSIPKLLGLEHAKLESGLLGLNPIALHPNLKVMSIGFMVESEESAVIWRGAIKYRMIQQFLRDVNWGALDYLIVDSPPGTGDEPLSVVQLMGQPAAAVVVTTPQDVAVADVRRSITFCRKVSLPVVGVVENMSGFACPHCGRTTDLFKAGGGEALAREMLVPFLGRVPLDPAVVVSGDVGKPFAEGAIETAAMKAFGPIVQSVQTLMQQLAGRAGKTASPADQNVTKES